MRIEDTGTEGFEGLAEIVVDGVLRRHDTRKQDISSIIGYLKHDNTTSTPRSRFYPAESSSSSMTK